VCNAEKVEIYWRLLQDKENMDPEVIKQTVNELQQYSLKVSQCQAVFWMDPYRFSGSGFAASLGSCSGSEYVKISDKSFTDIFKFKLFFVVKTGVLFSYNFDVSTVYTGTVLTNSA